MSEEQIKESRSTATIDTGNTNGIPPNKVEVVNYDMVTRQFMSGLMIKYGEEEVKAAIESLVYGRIKQLKKAQRVAILKEMINEDECL